MGLHICNRVHDVISRQQRLDGHCAGDDESIHRAGASMTPGVVFKALPLSVEASSNIADIGAPPGFPHNYGTRRPLARSKLPPRHESPTVDPGGRLGQIVTRFSWRVV